MIPDEAVEAALHQLHAVCVNVSPACLRLALEAAAPYILASYEALYAGRDIPEWVNLQNPPREPGMNWVEWLWVLCHLLLLVGGVVIWRQRRN